MKIVAIHDGPIDHALALTSVIQGLRKTYGKYLVTWMTNSKNAVFYRHLPCVDMVDINSKMPDITYDLVINFGGSAMAMAKSGTIKSLKYQGVFGADEDIDTLYDGNESNADVLYGSGCTKRNIFQVLYSMAGMKWRGEGYGFRYFPRTKAKEGNTGIAIQDESVRDYLRRHLELTDEKKLWHIPLRQDPLKQFDEVNYCENVITDNPLVMHAAICLRKHVEYLTYNMPSMKLEFFGKGHVHIVPEHVKVLAVEEMA